MTPLVFRLLIALACWFRLSCQLGPTQAADAPRTLRGATADEEAAFETSVRPLLAQHCFACHGGKKQEASLRLDTAAGVARGSDNGPVVVAGEPEQSPLVVAIRYEGEVQMPPAGKLSAADIAALVAWIKIGAPWPAEHAAAAQTGPVRATPESLWALRPLSDRPPPAVADPSWPLTGVDPFILARLEAQGITPAHMADKRTLIRRATFDLTGLPPTPEEVAEFLADESADAFAVLIDRLLDSPRYGERWGRHWLDVVRYADTAGETADYPVHEAYRYRDWVIDAFNRDLPYDEFIREQVAGDILAREGPPERFAERVTATGYLALSRRFGFDSENYHHLTIQDTIDNLGQAVLGLSLGCARCHDHKFDPLSMADYYALYGIFDSTRYAFPGSEQKQRTRAMAPLMPDEQARPLWRSYRERLAALQATLDRLKTGVPRMKLGTLDDIDGDFELQAPAAGGSRGVLVTPWLYRGELAVTAAAQSPWTRIYPAGTCGVSLPGDAAEHALGQAVWPPRTAAVVHASFDFRLGRSASGGEGSWRFFLGHGPDRAAVEAFVNAGTLFVRSGETVEPVHSLQLGVWYHLVLTVDLGRRRFAGTLGAPGEAASFTDKACSASCDGRIDYVAVDGAGHQPGVRPPLELDNLAVGEEPLPSRSTLPPSAESPVEELSVDEIHARIRRWVDLDGDFETQPLDAAPAFPWGPGPNSVVKIRAASQSPFTNVFPPGTRGIGLPNSGDYNGFGQTIAPSRSRDKCDTLYYQADFRVAGVEAGGAGSWRFYVGHGPGQSPAVELFATGDRFFLRGGAAIEPVGELAVGVWSNVQLALDLKTATYSGTLVAGERRIEFAGKAFAPNWDGTIDYTFVDSYGHLAGVKPALDVDNIALAEAPLLPPTESGPAAQPGPKTTAEERQAARRQVAELRAMSTRLAERGPRLKQEWAELIENGPFKMAYGVAEGTPHDAPIQKRGEPATPGELAPRRFPAVLGGDILANPSGSGRRELAEWLIRPSNPLTARVLVNRVWQHHFGTGLVATPNDFGSRGRLPTHPELLDALARRFIEGGWSIKSLHRLIMLSRTYQLSGAGDPRAAAVDPLNELLGHFPRRRLDAEAIRDAMLAVGGRLDPSRPRRHPFPPREQCAFTQHNPFNAVYETRHRSVYLMTQRLKRHPFLSLFDGADTNASTAERVTTTIPTQALFLMNDPFVHEQAAGFAERIVAAASDDAGRLAWAFELAFARPPTPVELAESGEFLARYRRQFEASGLSASDHEPLVWSALARTLLARNEFLFVD